MSTYANSATVLFPSISNLRQTFGLHPPIQHKSDIHGVLSFYFPVFLFYLYLSLSYSPIDSILPNLLPLLYILPARSCITSLLNVFNKVHL